MHLKVLITFFQKILRFIRVWATVHEILAIKISKKILNQQKFLKNSSTSNTHTIEAISHSIINNINFWKCVTRPFRCIYVNCFNRLRFLAEVSTKLQKMQFLDNLRTITQEESMGANPNFIWSNGWSILICKIPQFLTQSYRFRQLITLFEKVDTLRWPAIYIMFCTPVRAKYLFFRVQLMDYRFHLQDHTFLMHCSFSDFDH